MIRWRQPGSMAGRRPTPEFDTDARRAGSPPRQGTPDPEQERRRRLRRMMVVCLLGVVFLLGSAVALFGNRGALDLLRSRRQLRAMERTVATERARVVALRAQVERLKTDPKSVERIAREELGMARPGEIVLILPAEEGRRSAPGTRRGVPGEPERRR